MVWASNIKQYLNMILEYFISFITLLSTREDRKERKLIEVERQFFLTLAKSQKVLFLLSCLIILIQNRLYMLTVMVAA